MTAPAVPSRRVFVCGPSGSGKTEFTWRRVLPAFPRVLAVDFVGESWELAARYLPERPAVAAAGWQDAAMKLRNLAGVRRWALLAQVEPDAVKDLAPLLVPVPHVRAGYVAHLGGLALYLDECDLIAPATYCPPPIGSLFRRGRHAGLTVVTATQRPANVSKELTAQCELVVVFPMHEPADVAYLTSLIGRDLPGLLDRTRDLGPHSYLAFDTRARRATAYTGQDAAAWTWEGT